MKRRRSSGAPALDIVVYEHPDCSDHDTRTANVEHQENASRLTAIRERLERLEGVAFHSRFAAATRDDLSRVHSEAYIETLEDIEAKFAAGTLRAPEPLSPHVVNRLFPSAPVHGMTIVSGGSVRAARRAAGAVIAAIDGVLSCVAASEADAPSPPPALPLCSTAASRVQWPTTTSCCHSPRS